jgi:hypothetical protein
MKRLFFLAGISLYCFSSIFGQAPGDIIITEFMANPSAVTDANGEYVEIYNKRSVSFDLDGFILKDNGSDSHTITGPLVIGAESFLVLALNGDTGTNGGLTANYVITSGFSLTNSADEIVLTNASGTEIARVSWSSSSYAGSGIAEELNALSDVDHNGEAESADYSNASTTYGDGDNGSPGVAGSTDLSEDPTIRFVQGSETFDETEGTVNIGVILEDADGNTVDVDVIYNEEESSTEPSDFTSIATGSLSFSTAASGDETKTVSFEIHSDTEYEGAEYGFFELSNLSTTGAATISGDTTYTLNITDDDTPNVVINEVNKDPAEDADGNGVLDTADDEFIEIYNNEDINIDIGSWYITDKSGTIHTFASGSVLKAKSAIVIFDDSATPTGSFGGATVLKGDSNFSLANTEDTVSIFSMDHSKIDSVFWTSSSTADGVSYTRDPDGTGSFTDHDLATGSTGNISPGTKVDGSTFTNIIVIEGTAGWRLLSTPMENYDLTEISDDTPIQGVSGGSDSGSDPNVYYYDDSGTWEVPASVTTQYPEGYGFALYFFNNDDNGSLHLPESLDVSGSEPGTDISVSLGSTAVDGSYYTLVGNPFASNYDLSAITADDGDGIQDNVHFWDNEAGSYEPVDRTTPSIVSSWQGFWVEVVNDGSETSSITLPTSGKTFGAITDFHVSKAPVNRGDIFFRFTSDETTDKALRLTVRGDASTDYDHADASKLIPLTSNYATMAFKSGERMKSVESLPWDLEDEITIPVEAHFVGVQGEFNLEWEGFESVPEDWVLTFHDFEKGVNLDMRSSTNYSFNGGVESNEKVNPLTILKGPALVVQKSKSETPRFGITITPSANSTSNEQGEEPYSFELSQNYPNPFNPTTSINYSVNAAGPVTLSVYNLMGQKVSELVNEVKSPGSYNATFDASNMASGIYIYRLTLAGQTLTRKMTLIK